MDKNLAVDMAMKSVADCKAAMLRNAELMPDDNATQVFMSMLTVTMLYQTFAKRMRKHGEISANFFDTVNNIAKLAIADD